MTFAVIYFCFGSSVKSVLFCCFAGYLVQHIGYHLMFIIYIQLRRLVEPVAYDFMYIGCFAIPYTIAYFFFARRLKKIETLDMDNLYILGIAAVVAIATQIVSMYMNSKYGGSGIAGRIYAIIACIVTLLFQFGLFERSRLKQEKECIEQLLVAEAQQHDQSKENIAIINRKCHDLKHQIAAIRSMRDDEREESLREIEEATLIYESAAKTGNEALDVILTEKSLHCEKYNIKFEYMIDGKVLGFMKAVDIYTLFGNMLDNAIESVIKQDDAEKRIISLAVTSKNNIISIHMENYCEDDIIFVDGLPLTTKGDKNYHGFGMKSIKFIAGRYGGNLVISNKNKLFTVDIMIIL